MAIIEYLQSLLASLGVTHERMPMFLGVLTLVVVGMLARSFFARLGRVIEGVFFRNWQLGLLGTTGLVLSLASGWTTWDGMKNFTGEPILSAMVTFGIQGVMLIVAWLIGESFATGMNQQIPAGHSISRKAGGSDDILKFALGLTLVGVALGGVAGVSFLVKGTTFDWGRAATWLGIVGGVALASGLLIVAARTHTLRGYFDATRVIVRTGVLWIMFLACMATSVFFSFDSLFSTIFPASERVRAAELRAQNQVSGITADIGGTIARGLLDETEHLFASKGWEEYDGHLTKLTVAANESKTDVEKYFQKLMEDRRSGIAEQQGRMTTAQSGQVGLASKKVTLTDELARLKAERPALAEDFSKRKSDVDAIMKELDGKRVEAMAEARGVEGTGKIGEGAMFRLRKAEESALKDKQKIAEERLRDAQKRFQSVETRLTQIERELTLVDGDIAKLKGESQTAEQRIKLAEDAKTADEGINLDPTRQIQAFEKARAEFRQTPKIEGLAQVQTMCTQLLSAMAANPAVKNKVVGIDCDPKTAAEAAGRVFALNSGIVSFYGNCAGGDKLALHKTADALFGFARKCVQDSGLGSKDTDELRQQINFIELNRDDKANRFVVTWNAFQDGNRLAYLALAIAIAVDGLVFMSGLFGANAVRSPLSDMPTHKARSGEQLESIVDNALLPHKFENARIAIEAMHADTSVSGYTAIVDLRDLDPQSETVVRRVLNAGATIGAVLRNPEAPTVYAIRPELYEYLAITGARAFEKHGKLVEEDIAAKVRQGDLEKLVRVALLPDEMGNAETVLHYAHPMNATDDGFMSQIILKQVAVEDVRVVRRVLNAGAAHRAVRIAQGEDQPYEIHADLYKTLSRIRARMLLSTGPTALQIGRGSQQVQNGGALRDAIAQIAPSKQPRPEAQSRQNTMRDFAFDGEAADENQLPRTPRAVDAARREQNQRRHMAEPVHNDEPLELSALQKDFIGHFQEVAHIDGDVLKYILRHTRIDTSALSRAIKAVQRCDPHLNRLIADAESQCSESIATAIETYDAPKIGVKDWHSAFNDTAEAIRRAVPILLLRSGGSYDHILAFALDELAQDDGAGKLSYVMRQRRDLLAKHRADLLEARNGVDYWIAVQHTLTTFATNLAALGVNEYQSLQSD